MSNFNYQWVADNFEDKDLTIFIIGVANIAEVMYIKPILPESTIHTFECAKVWEGINASVTDSTGKHTLLEKVFHHIVAVSDHDGNMTFYPSEIHKDKLWPWSGSMFPPSQEMMTDEWKWGKPYTVPCITINSFCKTHNIKPDMIHMDVQGAEFLILKNLNDDIRPKCMWLEISAFNQYETKSSYEELNNLLLNYGYIQEYCDDQDALYVLQDLVLSKYESKQ